MNKTKLNDLVNYLAMTVPTLAVYALVITMIGKTAHLSLFEWDGINERSFVGLKNYLELFRDYRFVYAMRNIGVLISYTVFIQVGLGLLLAFFLTDLKVRFAGTFKTIIFLPVVISNVAVALYFVTFFDYQYGILNHFFVMLGLERANTLGAGARTIFFVSIPQTWQYIGLMFIIGYTGFSTVPEDHVAASKVDGLNAIQRLFHIYIPISWDSVSVCFVIAMVGPLKAFEHIFIMTTGGGSDQLSHIPATLMYYLGFQTYEYGYGSAIAFFICVLAVLLVVVFRSLFRSRVST